MKTALTVAIGFLLGILASGAGAFWALQNGYVPGFGAQVTQPEWPDVTPAAGEKPTVASDVKIEDQVLPIPKAAASEEFQKALQLTVVSHNNLTETGTLLVDKLNEMNARSTSRNFDGFFDLVFDAKTLLAQQVSGTGDLSLALGKLERELPNVTDPNIAATAATMIAKGKKLTAALGAYSSAVEPVLSGKIPGQADINLIFDSATALSAASKEFNVAAEAVGVSVRAALESAPITETQRVNGAL